MLNDWLHVPGRDGTPLRVRAREHPRARRLRLSISARGARLSCPRGTSERRCMAFLKEHSAWLEDRLDELQLGGTLAQPLRAGTPDSFRLRGSAVALHWRDAPALDIAQHADKVVISLPRPWDTPQALARARDLLHGLLHNSMARDINPWLSGYCEQLGRAPTGIRIRSFDSQWGSLGSRDRLSLDLSLALAPPDALRYVLAHELAHLVERNHSPRFWHQVAQLMPAYAAQRVWLHEHGGPLKVELNRLLVD